MTTRPFLLSIVGCILVHPAGAQQMPQDNWRYDGLKFSGPAPAAELRSIAIGAEGVYVGEVSAGGVRSILQFTEGGVFVRRFIANFTFLSGLACDSAGNVYAADAGESKVKAFTGTGTFLSEWGSSGADDGQFDLPSSGTAIAVDKNDQIYVCDARNSRVQVFNSNGVFLRKWGHPGALPSEFPANKPDSIAWGPAGELFVGCHNGGPSLRVFGEDGAYRRSGEIVSSANILYSHAVTPDGLLLAGTFTFGDPLALRVYDTSLTLLKSIELPTQFGLAVNKKGDVYSIQGNVVKVLKREYSNVQNSLLPPAIPQPIVLAAVQRTGTSWLDIDYRVTDADSPTVTTAVLAFKNGGTTLNEAVVMSTFVEGTGANVGTDQPTGVSRRLTWNMAADWTVDFAQVQVEALAKDSRNLLGFHWITVPASGGNPAIQVSKSPVTDDKLLDVWFWLLAIHEPGITLNNGTITSTPYPGPVLPPIIDHLVRIYPNYVGSTLANGTTTTEIGRAYLYGQTGVRAITAAEITQAQGGSYGFSSVDVNSVVKVP